MGNSSLRDAPRQGAANVTGHGNGNSLESGLNLFCSGEVGGGGLSLPAAGPRLEFDECYDKYSGQMQPGESTTQLSRHCKL